MAMLPGTAVQFVHCTIGIMGFKTLLVASEHRAFSYSHKGTLLNGLSMNRDPQPGFCSAYSLPSGCVDLDAMELHNNVP